MPKNVKGGTLWNVVTYIQLQVMKKTRRGDPFGTLKIFSRKSRTVPKKIQRGDPLGTSGFESFFEKVKK